MSPASRPKITRCLLPARSGPHLKVSAAGLGCMGFSQSYGQADEQESMATIHRALELGATLFGTAEVHGPFHNEEEKR